jgi:mannosyltransferase
VVPPGDVPAIAAALDAILGDPAAAASMGSRAREWVVREASYDAMQPVLRGVVERAVSARTAPA